MENKCKLKKDGTYRIEFVNKKEELFIIYIEIDRKIIFLLFFIFWLMLLLMFFPFYKEENNSKNKLYWDETAISIIDLEKKDLYDFNVDFYDKKISKKKYSKNVLLKDTFDSRTALNNKICPGSSGSFCINISTQNSNVDMKYKVLFEDLSNDKPQNILFSIEGKNEEFTTLQELEKYLIGNIKSKSERNIIINWRWPYETHKNLSDFVDTNDGKSLDSYRFKIVVNGEEALK